MNVILDLDGVIWLADQPIAGSPEAVGRLRRAGHRLLFLTNNSNPTVAHLVDKLAGMGIEAAPEQIATSSQAAAALVAPGATALVCGGPGVVEALAARGAETVTEGPADAVVVGFHREFDYGRLTAAFRAIAGGAVLIGTNDDTTYPTPSGPVPGGGAILAAVAAAGGVEPVVAGKPYQPMADLVHARLGTGGPTVLIGDRPSTDGLMARRLGVPFVLVLSGVTTEEPIAPEAAPALVAARLADVVGPDGQVQESA
ncbi:MAG: HAD-IIA family hydrolase [Actinomycetota bacterium]|jgi:HAD superfamily hydrolase (TIGR01450 family)